MRSRARRHAVLLLPLAFVRETTPGSGDSAIGGNSRHLTWLQVNAATDKNLANLGQLKTVFNFDLSGMGGGGTPAIPNPVTSVTASNSVKKGQASFRF